MDVEYKSERIQSLKKYGKRKTNIKKIFVLLQRIY